jgi:hypothetical protein
MMFRRGDSGVVHVQLSSSPQENFCRPAVDPMLRSLAVIYGRDLLAIILTGMGQDGLLGCQAVLLNPQRGPRDLRVRAYRARPTSGRRGLRHHRSAHADRADRRRLPCRRR